MNKFGIDVSNLPTQKSLQDFLSPSKIEAWERSKATAMVGIISDMVANAVQSGRQYIVLEIPSDRHTIFVSRVKPFLKSDPYNYQVSHTFSFPNSSGIPTLYSIIEWDVTPPATRG